MFQSARARCIFWWYVFDLSLDQCLCKICLIWYLYQADVVMHILYVAVSIELIQVNNTNITAARQDIIKQAKEFNNEFVHISYMSFCFKPIRSVGHCTITHSELKSFRHKLTQSITFLFLLSLRAYRRPLDGYLRNWPGFVASSHCHFAIIHPHFTHCSKCSLCYLT